MANCLRKKGTDSFFLFRLLFAGLAQGVVDQNWIDRQQGGEEGPNIKIRDLPSEGAEASEDKRPSDKYETQKIAGDDEEGGAGLRGCVP